MAKQSLPFSNSNKQPCLVDGCDGGNGRRVHGYCRRHYLRLYRTGSPVPPTLSARVWQRVQIADSDSCWLWTGTLTGTGYGVLGYKGSSILAHRAVFSLFHNREIGEGLFILHSCDNPPCCNPSHLREGSHADNMRDKVDRGRTSRYHSQRTHCRNGHKYTPENTTHFMSDGYRCRQCRTCGRIRSLRSYHRKVK